MANVTAATLMPLDFVVDGQPFVLIDTWLNTKSLDVVAAGVPFVGANNSFLPTKGLVLAVDYIADGLPFANIEAKAAATQSLDLVLNGLPFVGAGFSGGLTATSDLGLLYTIYNAVYVNLQLDYVVNLPIPGVPVGLISSAADNINTTVSCTPVQYASQYQIEWREV